MLTRTGQTLQKPARPGMLLAWAILLAAGARAGAQSPATSPATLPATTPAPPASLPGFEVASKDFDAQWYGDAEDVALLAGLLKDADLNVRLRAVADLGHTRNLAALAPLGQAMKDPDLSVRCAAIHAAGRLAANAYVPPGLSPAADAQASRAGRQAAEAMVLQALRAAEPQAILGAVRACSAFAVRPDAASNILLEHADPQIRAEMLACLTSHAQAAPASALSRLLKDVQPLVRLRAAENARHAHDASLIEPLLQTASGEGPATASLALEAAAKVATAANQAALPGLAGAIDQAGQHKHPLMRAAAVRGHETTGQAKRIRPFLDDPSPLVRQAAMAAASRLNCTDCVERLFQLMMEAPLDDYLQTYRDVPPADPHWAAREALACIRSPRVVELAGAKLAELAPEIRKVEELYVAGTFGTRKAEAQMTGDFRMRQYRLQRDVSACAELLGRHGTTQKLDLQMELMRALPVDSVAVLHLARSLGRIGDRRAVGPLIETLRVCASSGRAYLVAAAAQQPPPFPYHDNVAAAVIDALGRLNDPRALDIVLGIATVDVGKARLTEPARQAARVLPQWAGPEAAHKRIEGFLVTMLQGQGYSMFCQHEAARAAVRLRLASAVEPLRQILKDRYNDTMARASAWAIAELTGQAPPVPDPRPRPGDWIIRKAGR